MSRNPVVVAAGQRDVHDDVRDLPQGEPARRSTTAASAPTCAGRCGSTAGRPMDLVHTVTSGVPVKGMPTWGPILGQRKIAEAVAYVLSYHQEGEPMSVQAPK